MHQSETKYCFACGEAIDYRAEICPKCGVRQHAAPFSLSSSEDPIIRQAASTKLVAGILGIFIGALGIHKFVLGLTTPAITMLLVTILTCGIGGLPMGIIGLIEGILYLTKTDEDFYQTYIVEKKGWF